MRAARAACLATGTRGGCGCGGRGGGVAARTEDEASSACNLNISASTPSGHTVLGACALTRAAMDQAQHMQASPEWDFPLFFR